VFCGWMQLRMQNSEALTIDQIRGFLDGTAEVSFVGQKREEVYGWVERLLLSQEFLRQDKQQRGTIRAYVAKVTGLSSAQVTRLIRLFRNTGGVKAKAYRRRMFMRIYTDPDIALLAAVDRAHERLSGPATRRILEREYASFGKAEFERLAKISNGQLYNLRASAEYRRVAAVYQPTQATAVSIGERRRPEPQGRPGYLRVDTVHQGDWDGAKGVYHINAVDAVTQWQVVGCASRISEAYLLPVLEAMLHQFPFQILGFHSDNGSEYVNRKVAELLEKLRIEFTKSRANRSQDNALVEGKNGAVIRKLMGYGHIAGEHAEALQKFYTAHLNPYLNFHRPCGFATVSVDARGRQRRQYKAEDYVTPYEKFKSLPDAESYLKEKLSFAFLDRQANRLSDTECAQKMAAAKAILLRKVKSESPIPPRFH
jgi:transposase InsO family protein